FAVREAATNNLKRLVAIFGSNWARASVLPKIVQMSNDQNYLHRMTCLFCINVLAEVCETSLVEENMLPIVYQMAADQVPNVRFNVCKTIHTICNVLKTAQQNTKSSKNKSGASGGGSKLSGAQLSQMKGVLDKLAEDADVDVRFFAAEALQAPGVSEATRA
ncbi:uncharacterized protein LOC142356873, partial [Convolutriloba macropyga]